MLRASQRFILLFAGATGGVSGGSTADTTPDAFSFTDVTGATISTLYTSDQITVAGIDAATSLTISAGEVQVNSGSWTAAPASLSVVVNDLVRVRITSSNSYSTAVTVVVTIGGVQDTYSVTTEAGPGDFTDGAIDLSEPDATTNAPFFF